MNAKRRETALSLLKGLLAAVALTLVGMAGIAALALGLRVSDGTIRALNQLLKCAAILLGATVAIGRGGSRGFITGATLAILYMALGYAMAVGLGGGAFMPAGMLGELLIGAALGGAAGAVFSNLPPRRRRARAA